MARNFCLLILFIHTLFGADFIYSAQLSNNNQILSFYNFWLSPMMKKRNNLEEFYACSIHQIKPQNVSEYEFLLNLKDELFECFLNQKIKIYNSSTFTIDHIHSQTQLFFLPIYFRAYFLADKIVIVVLK